MIPVFVDVNHDDLNINLDDLKKYTKDCVALICVHMGGHGVQWIKFNHGQEEKIVFDRRLINLWRLIQRKKNRWSDIACLVLKKKIMTTGDGMLVLDKKDYEKLKSEFSWMG